MLASLLPGLRDLRVPLTAGFLWLTVIWLWVYPVIPSKDEATGITVAVYELFGALGPGTLLAVMAFIAYLVGIVLGKIGVILKYTVMIFQVLLGSDLGTFILSPGSVRQMEDRLRRMRQSLQQERRVTNASILEFVDPRMYESMRSEAPAAMEVDEDGTLDRTVSRILSRRVFDEIPLVATRLLAKNKDLFDRYDRADAEANFRFAVVVPLVFISAIVQVRLYEMGLIEGWGAVIITLVTTLFLGFIVYDGLLKAREANDAVYQAVFIGEADFPIIEEISKLGSPKTPQIQGSINMGVPS